MPDVRNGTYRTAQQELDDLPDLKITTTARHKDVTLPDDHSTWHVCTASPPAGTRITGDDSVVLKLAKKAHHCDISHHGYLHQTNDPAYTPPPPPKPKPEPKPTHTTQQPGSSLTTCPDGKQGYACTSNGHPVVDGQFCPNADRGRTLKATNGTMVTCSYDPSIEPYRWQ